MKKINKVLKIEELFKLTMNVHIYIYAVYRANQTNSRELIILKSNSPNTTHFETSRVDESRLLTQLLNLLAGT